MHSNIQGVCASFCLPFFPAAVGGGSDGGGIRCELDAAAELETLILGLGLAGIGGGSISTTSMISIGEDDTSMSSTSSSSRRSGSGGGGCEIEGAVGPR
jgi:hypothetical protein